MKVTEWVRSEPSAGVLAMAAEPVFQLLPPAILVIDPGETLK